MFDRTLSRSFYVREQNGFHVEVSVRDAVDAVLYLTMRDKLLERCSMSTAESWQSPRRRGVSYVIRYESYCLEEVVLRIASPQGVRAVGLDSLRFLDCARFGEAKTKQVLAEKCPSAVSKL